MFLILFKAILGHRYGQRVLPSQINNDNFKILKDECQNLDITFTAENEDKSIFVENLLEFFYVRDENDLPTNYKLLDSKSLLNRLETKV